MCIYIFFGKNQEATLKNISYKKYHLLSNFGLLAGGRFKTKSIGSLIDLKVLSRDNEMVAKV